jgi:hypothetical protein
MVVNRGLAVRFRLNLKNIPSNDCGQGIRGCLQWGGGGAQYGYTPGAAAAELVTPLQ